MERALSVHEAGEVIVKNQPKLQPFFPLKQLNLKPSYAFSFWVLKSAEYLKNKAGLQNRISRKRLHFDGMVVNNSVCFASPNCLEPKMEMLVIENEILEEEREGICEEIKGAKFTDFDEGSGENSLSSDVLASDEVMQNYEYSSSADSSSPPSMQMNKMPHAESFKGTEEVDKPHLDKRKSEKQGSSLSETEMMKERFSKLLLGEDMSGCGNGFCAALAISNAITNLCATLFGQVWRLEPLPHEKKVMWQRELQWLLCVSDHIVELTPSWQTFPDGSKLEVMTSRPRSDLCVNLPALCKLDNMLIDILDSFKSPEFWYVDQGISAAKADGSSSFHKPLPFQEDKWWFPVPRVPPDGLSQDERKMLEHKRDCMNQILKAAMVINEAVLAEMGVPDLYLESLPKNGKSSLGDAIYHRINSDHFSPEILLECLDLSSEHHALEIANRIEAAIYVWHQKLNPKPSHSTHRSSSKSSWELVKDLVGDAYKTELLAGRAEDLLLSLKHRFPGLPQTTLDTAKIQCNKDVGKSILESYSRVLKSLAFNIMARIDDLLYVDDLSKHSDQLVSISKIGVITHKSTGIAGPVFTTPTFSPSHLMNHAEGDKSTHAKSSRISIGRFGVRTILTDHPSVHTKGTIEHKGSINSF